jgi:hypothetical protein
VELDGVIGSDRLFVENIYTFFCSNRLDSQSVARMSIKTSAYWSLWENLYEYIYFNQTIDLAGMNDGKFYSIKRFLGEGVFCI